ncbi:DUF1127 domain-containing protein [Roseovarius aestuarii]|nr:DUF1127 domain-containing protein [Roseovarius aestuarii]
MNYASTTTAQRTFFGFGVTASWSKIKDRMDKSRAYSRTVNELSSLGTMELNDLGIARHQIADKAHECVYGTRRTA